MKKIITIFAFVILGLSFENQAVSDRGHKHEKKSKVKRSERLLNRIVPFYYYDNRDSKIERVVVYIDLTQMKSFDEFLAYVKEGHLYLESLIDFDSICISGLCFRNTQEFEDSVGSIKEALDDGEQFYVPLPWNDPSEFYFADIELYDNVTNEDVQKIFESLRDEILEIESYDSEVEERISDGFDSSDALDLFSLETSSKAHYSPNYNESDEYM